MIVPMVPEAKALLGQNTDAGNPYGLVENAPFPLWVHQSKSCGIVACGQGKVQAALAASWAILHILQKESSKLLLFGTAAGVQLEPGALCVADSCEEYDFLVPGRKPHWNFDKGQPEELRQRVKQYANDFLGTSAHLWDAHVMSADQDYHARKSLFAEAETHDEDTPTDSALIYTWESAGFWRSVTNFAESGVAAVEIRVISDSGWSGSLKEFRNRVREVIQPVSGFVLSLLETV